MRKVTLNYFEAKPEKERAWKYTKKHFPSLIDKFNEWGDK